MKLFERKIFILVVEVFSKTRRLRVAEQNRSRYAKEMSGRAPRLGSPQVTGLSPSRSNAFRYFQIFGDTFLFLITERKVFSTKIRVFLDKLAFPLKNSLIRLMGNELFLLNIFQKNCEQIHFSKKPKKVYIAV